VPGRVIDASRKLILPVGSIHTHFDLPMFNVFSDDHYTGHKAAAFGESDDLMDLCRAGFPPWVSRSAPGDAKAEGRRRLILVSI
jgi:dihydropyrimidinase